MKSKYFLGIVMPSEKDNILEFNQYMKSHKMACIIYAEIESLVRKIHGCANNPENSATTKIGEHIPCGYSMPKIWGYFISWKRLSEKLYFFKRTRKKCN